MAVIKMKRVCQSHLWTLIQRLWKQYQQSKFISVKQKYVMTELGLSQECKYALILKYCKYNLPHKQMKRKYLSRFKKSIGYERFNKYLFKKFLAKYRREEFPLSDKMCLVKSHRKHHTWQWTFRSVIAFKLFKYSSFDVCFGCLPYLFILRNEHLDVISVYLSHYLLRKNSKK